MMGTVADLWILGRLNEYQVIGRHLPTEMQPTPKLYRMRIFAPNTVVAKSRFWYFLMKLRKVKKSNGEIITINLVSGSYNFGRVVKWDEHKIMASTRAEWLMMMVMHRSMRDVLQKSRTSAFGSATIRARVLTICIRSTARCQGRKQSMRFTKIWQQDTERVSDRSMYVTFRIMRPRCEYANDCAQILKVVELEATDDVKRPYIKQLLSKNLKFPLPHRVAKTSTKKLFSAQRPSTFA